MGFFGEGGWGWETAGWLASVKPAQPGAGAKSLIEVSAPSPEVNNIFVSGGRGHTLRNKRRGP